MAPLLQAGIGPGLLVSGAQELGDRERHPAALVFIFFRDTNLTDVMFRLDEQYRWSLDIAAHDREDELNAVVARRSSAPAVPRARGASTRVVSAPTQARRWIEPARDRVAGRAC